MSTIDLSQLPPPDVLEPLDFEAVYQEILSQFRVLMGESWSANLESDPVVKLLELAAYREIMLRARINDAARANLLAFAGGTDLDQLGAFYGCGRVPDEGDERYRLRIQLRIASLAGNGTAEQYRLHALSASIDVVDAAVLQPVPGRVDIALWLRDGVNSAVILAAVKSAFLTDDARMLGVILTVRLAIACPISVSATVWREQSAPLDLAIQLAAALPEQIANYAKLGRDVPRSWLLSRLHAAGVARVELAGSDLFVGDDEYATVGSITIADGGVAW